MRQVEKSQPAVTVDAQVIPVSAARKARAFLHSMDWLPLFPLAVVWLSLFWVLSTDWSINSQYSYVWLVPFLGLAVFWRRWNSRPPSSPGNAAAIPAIAGALILFCALPIRLIEEANPEWRLILWLHAGWVVASSFLLLSYTGGGRWARHFAFVV